jgi:hypothetical protein
MFWQVRQMQQLWGQEQEQEQEQEHMQEREQEQGQEQEHEQEQGRPWNSNHRRLHGPELNWAPLQPRLHRR